MSSVRRWPQKIPINPGVYFFRDKRGRILYIGKAVNLRTRVSSYFNKQPKDSRISKMLELAARTRPVRGREGAQRDPASYGVTWQITDSEIEALILESQLIKKHLPPFNIALRDDKQYFYVGFTKEQFPKIFLTHQPTSIYQNTQVETWTGPFTDGGALKTALRLLRRIFPYCTCKQKHNNYCLNYHIGKCLGFCCLKQQKPGSRLSAPGFQQKEYLKNIKAIKVILEGKRSSLVKNFKKEMLQLGKKHEFENAIELRGKIEKLEKIFENARILLNTRYRILDTESDRNSTTALKELAKLLKMVAPPKRIEGYDISNIQGEFATGAMVVFTNGRPDKNEYRKFKIRQNFRTGLKNTASSNRSENLGGQVRKPMSDVAMLKEVLTRRFNHLEWPYPDLVLVDGGKAQLGAARLTVPKQTPVIALTKNDRHRGDHIYVTNKKMAIPLKNLPISARDLILQVDTEAHRFAISYYRKLHRKFF